MTDAQQSELSERLLFLGTAGAVLISRFLLIAAGLTQFTAMLAATVTVLVVLVLPGRFLFWILGTALFFAVGLLPWAMYMQYATDATVRAGVFGVTANIFLLLCFATTFGPLQTRH